MAVTKKKGGAAAPPKVAATPSTPAGSLALPTVPTKPRQRLKDYLVLIYGEKKIGKSTLVSRFEKTFFLMMEPGGKALEIFQPTDDAGNPTPIQSWGTFLDYMALLEKDKAFETVCIDTVDLAYQLCQDWVCEKRGFEHPNDAEDYGKTWSACKQEFHRALIRLGALDKGLVLLSHAKDKEITKRSGIKHSVILPTMSNQAWEVVEPLVDCVFYYTYGSRKGERVLQLQGDELVSAGNRLQNEIDAFMLDGRPLHEIDMGSNPDQAYRNLLDAFECKYKPPQAEQEEIQL